MLIWPSPDYFNTQTHCYNTVSEMNTLLLPYSRNTTNILNLLPSDQKKLFLPCTLTKTRVLKTVSQHKAGNTLKTFPIAAAFKRDILKRLSVWDVSMTASMSHEERAFYRKSVPCSTNSTLAKPTPWAVLTKARKLVNKKVTTIFLEANWRETQLTWHLFSPQS